jgi:excisionase family DNA binding protein
MSIINELIKTEKNFTVSIGTNELNEWLFEVIRSTKKELVLSEKTESYPTVKQVSEMLNVNASTLYRWNKKNYLKTIEFGGGRRYKMSEVKALLNGGRS